MDIDGLLFVSLRADWSHPFFHLLGSLLLSHGGKLSKTNQLNEVIKGKGKLYALNSLYKENVHSEFALVYNCSKEHVEPISKYLFQNMGQELILKEDLTQTGCGVFAVRLPHQKHRLEKIANKRSYFYVTPFYEFKTEYRFYFTKFEDIKIHSIKTKKVLTKKEELFKAESFIYWENVELEWEYVAKDEWVRHDYATKKALQYLEYLEYFTGSLEFGLTNDDEFVFFEVNSMSDPVAFAGEDVESMQGYYEEIFSKLLGG